MQMKRTSALRRFAWPSWIVAILLSALPFGADSVHAQDNGFAQLSSAAQSIALEINRVRSDNGLGPLAVHPLLNAAAQTHVDDILANYNYSHWGTDGTLARDRVARTGYAANPWVSENWVSSSDPAGAMRWWMNDYIHRVNILTPRWVEVGIGAGSRGEGGEMIFVTVFSAGASSDGLAAMPPEAPPEPRLPAAPASIPAEGLEYTIRSGDTLLGIALRYGMNWQDLAAVNGLEESSLLQIGQSIFLPGTGSPSTGLGGAATPSGVALKVGSPYIVRAGDTLFTIAARHGMTWQDLATNNGLSDREYLQIGDVLYVPESTPSLLVSPKEPAVNSSQRADALPENATAEQTNATAEHAVVTYDEQDYSVPTDIVRLAAAPVVAPASLSADPDAEVPEEPEVMLSAAQVVLTDNLLASVPVVEPTNAYVVRTGDTIISIALDHDLDWQELLAVNGLDDQSILLPGQEIRLR